jgi:3-keto-L-gulonate-6-phosphate decarboxylase
MKLQISCDFTDLEEAVKLAHEVAPYCDILEIGTILLYTHGLETVRRFRKEFPSKTILVDTKLIDRAQPSVELMARAGADWITVMAGTPKEVIHTICKEAAKHKLKVLLDLLDAASAAQMALEAKNLGAHALLFHQAYDADASLVFLDSWHMVKENASLPLFVSAHINRNNLEQIIGLNPYGMIIGHSIFASDDPAAEAQFYYGITSK